MRSYQVTPTSMHSRMHSRISPLISASHLQSGDDSRRHQRQRHTDRAIKQQPLEAGRWQESWDARYQVDDTDAMDIDGGTPRQRSPPPLLHKGLVLSPPRAGGGGKVGQASAKKAPGLDEVGLCVERHRGMDGRQALSHVQHMYARPATAPQLAQELPFAQMQQQHVESHDHHNHASQTQFESQASPPAAFVLPSMRFNCPPLPPAR